MRRRLSLFTLFCVALGCGVPSIGGAAEGGEKPPKLVQLSYDEEPGAQGYDNDLGAFVKRADSVRFTAVYDGERKRAPGKYKSSVTDTDINDPEAKHPWIPDPAQGGRAVVKVVRKSLQETGEARVKVTAVNEAGRKKTSVTIVLADCAQDPPLYPVSCEVRP